MAKDKKMKTTSQPMTNENPSMSSVGRVSTGSTQSVTSVESMNKTIAQKSMKKSKKDKKANTTSQPNLAGLSPEQMTQLQLEEAIKESQNPSMKLKKLKSPLSVKGCLINIIVFIVLSIIVAFAYIAIFKVHQFNLWFVIKDVFNDFGITQFFGNFFKRVGNLFRGNGWTLDAVKLMF